jgi:hypothetical protein
MCNSSAQTDMHTFASITCVSQIVMKSLTQYQYLITRALVYCFTLGQMRGNQSIQINISRCTRCTHVLTEVLHRIYIYMYYIACWSIFRLLSAVSECDISQNNSHRTVQTWRLYAFHYHGSIIYRLYHARTICHSCWLSYHTEIGSLIFEESFQY